MVYWIAAQYSLTSSSLSSLAMRSEISTGCSNPLGLHR